MDDEKSTSGDRPEDPLADWLRQLGLGGGGELDLPAMLSQLQQAMSVMAPGANSGELDWTQARHAVRQVVASLGTDRTMDAQDQRLVADADRLAVLWLDPNVDFTAPVSTPQAWSRAEWVEQTMDSWQEIVAPVISRLANALADSFSNQFSGAQDMPADFAHFAKLLTPMLRGAAGQLYAMQLSQAIGRTASQVVSGSELGLQVLPRAQVVLLPTNVAAFAAGLGVSAEDVRLYLAVRENARQRLFGQVGWLGPQLLALVEHYAREITIDVSALTDAIDAEDVHSMSPERLSQLSEQLQGRLFMPIQTKEQLEIIGRLETLIALVEGWVDEVTSTTLGKWMPQAAPLLDEAIRRRRATDNPGQQLFSALLGMDLRPRRVRDAANLWAALTRDRGVSGRDAVWAHPDLMPTADDLDDPLRVLDEQPSSANDDLDIALAELLAQAERERRDLGGDQPKE